MSISGKADLMGAKFSTDHKSLKNTAMGKTFTCLCYSPDGTILLAAGQSKLICMYSAETGVLLRKFVVTRNTSLDGVAETRDRLTEAGRVSEFLLAGGDSLVRKAFHDRLPGVTRGQTADRNLKPKVNTKAVQFSPTGRAWAAATTEGIIIYSLDESLMFDPIDLDIDITPTTIFETLSQAQYTKALVMSFKLNELDIIKKVFENIPIKQIQLVAQGFPLLYVKKLLEFLGSYLEDTPHIEFVLTWSMHLFNYHGRHLKDNPTSFVGVLRTLMKNTQRLNSDIGKMCNENLYTLEYFSAVTNAEKNTTIDNNDEDINDKEEAEEKEDDDEEIDEKGDYISD